MLQPQTFASVVSLLNDYRLASNKSTLGFLNPLLYSNGSTALNDILSGSNPGCNTAGFSAAPGWDPVSVRAAFGNKDFEANARDNAGHRTRYARLWQAQGTCRRPVRLRRFRFLDGTVDEGR